MNKSWKRRLSNWSDSLKASTICSGFNTIQAGVKVTLGPKDVATKDPQVLDSSILAVLVKVNGGEGAVRLGDGTNVRTGANQDPGSVIVTVKPGQICALLGHPSVRFFRNSS